MKLDLLGRTIKLSKFICPEVMLRFFSTVLDTVVVRALFSEKKDVGSKSVAFWPIPVLEWELWSACFYVSLLKKVQVQRLDISHYSFQRKRICQAVVCDATEKFRAYANTEFTTCSLALN